MPAGPTAPCMSTMGAPTEGRRSRVGSRSVVVAAAAAAAVAAADMVYVGRRYGEYEKGTKTGKAKPHRSFRAGGGTSSADVEDNGKTEGGETQQGKGKLRRVS